MSSSASATGRALDFSTLSTEALIQMQMSQGVRGSAVHHAEQAEHRGKTFIFDDLSSGRSELYSGQQLWPDPGV